ncbi:MAG: hypothetical protein M3004_05255 [Bacteroidota bacterium]|nr:hypothetical protein [Bacteroidota bacterium]
MRYSILFSIFIIFLFSCKKTKYTTTPQLNYKSVNTKVLSRGQTLQITLSFTDAEGDFIPDSALFVEKFEPKCVASRFKQYYKLPVFPTSQNQAGDIVVSYTYPSVTFLGPQCNRNDTAIFKFVLRDKAKNHSDTAVSDPIVIIN